MAHPLKKTRRQLVSLSNRYFSLGNNSFLLSQLTRRRRRERTKIFFNFLTIEIALTETREFMTLGPVVSYHTTAATAAVFPLPFPPSNDSAVGILP